MARGIQTVLQRQKYWFDQRFYHQFCSLLYGDHTFTPRYNVPTPKLAALGESRKTWLLPWRYQIGNWELRIVSKKAFCKFDRYKKLFNLQSVQRDLDIFSGCRFLTELFSDSYRFQVYFRAKTSLIKCQVRSVLAITKNGDISGSDLTFGTKSKDTQNTNCRCFGKSQVLLLLYDTGNKTLRRKNG